jgi:predicted nuclease with RNAse H fold
LFNYRVYSSVQEVLDDIVGVYGEWGDISGVAVDAPLTWAAAPGGVRESDIQLRALLPGWAPNTWVRAPNSQVGASVIQGPALVWAMAREAKLGTLPLPAFYEAHPRASLVRIAGDLRDAVLGYRNRKLAAAAQAKHVGTLVDRLVNPGILKLEVGKPKTSDELDALMCAMTALACGAPECGLVVRELPAEQIRPVGERSLMILDALP